MENGKKDYYLGLDIGTNSVGYAVTDTEYNIQKFRKRSMWGVNLFEEGQQADTRRLARNARKSLSRKRQRAELIRELFAAEIAKTDEKFYDRLDESFLYREDKSDDTANSIFADNGFTDKEYHSLYPTIHHLIMELINNKTPHDVRLVYLAVSYIVTHRGHFLYDVNKEDIDALLSFDQVYETFLSCLDEDSRWHGADKDEISRVLLETSGKRNTQDKLKTSVFGSDKLLSGDKTIISAVTGGVFSLADLFGNEAYKELEKLSFEKADIDDSIEAIMPELGDDADLVWALKGIYDWTAISKMMSGGKEKYISNTKIRQYEKHQKDLKLLKAFVKKYVPDKYNEVFRTAYKDKANYTAYSKNIKSSKIADKDYKYRKIEDFSKYIKGIFKGVVPDEGDKEAFEKMMFELGELTFMPKQKNTDNRMIPYQLYWYELKAILGNAGEYLAFLREADEDGLTVCDKIMSVFEFKIPYYVGPLGTYKNKNAWIERKKEGKILPWNFDEMVDKDKSEEAFIRSMTRKCSYLAGMDVLPKNSLLYSKFAVLNAINKICYDNIPITVEQKQAIYRDLFLSSDKKVTKKAILLWLKSNGVNAEKITGMEDGAILTMKPYHIFRRLIVSGTLSENQVEEIIARMTLTTDKRRLKKWLGQRFDLSAEDIAYVSKQKFSEYGRLSGELLCEVEAVNKETGELLSIINAMWETNCNLMELLSDRFGYAEAIKEHNERYYSEYGRDTSDILDEMYVSNAVKRPIFRTIDIVKEILSIQKCEPKKIFIEVTRTEKPKDRTTSRKQQLLNKYKNITDAAYGDLKHTLEGEEESRLKSKRLYLYYSQLGRCMYTGESISLSLLMSNSDAYDIDHIYPQSKVKDDSLDNMVLVRKDANGRKSDTYPLDRGVQQNMTGFWHALKDKGLISPEKFYRLTRTSTFKDEELAGFINRQAVETSQAIKAVALILQNMCQDSEIVYVKSRLASSLRDVIHMHKSREINDLHHAKDAYLNIVIGNIYNVQFTKSPMNFIKNLGTDKRYTIKLTEKAGQGLLSRNIERGGVVAWRGDGSYLNNVIKTMRRNDIQYVRYPLCRKGQLFNLNIERAPHGENDLVPIKKGLDTQKYGGYNNTTASFFTLVKYTKGKKDIVAIYPVDLIIADRFKADDDFALKWLSDKYKLQNPRFISKRKVIKINTLIEFENGFRANIAAKSNKGKTIVLSSIESLTLNGDMEEYARRVCGIITKAKEEKTLSRLSIDEKHDKITASENMQLYDCLMAKTTFKLFGEISAFNSLHELMLGGRDTFEQAPLAEQVQILNSIIAYFKTGRTTACDLTGIGGSKQSGTLTIGADLNKNICIIDQSPTGLFESRSENLLEL